MCYTLYNSGLDETDDTDDELYIFDRTVVLTIGQLHLLYLPRDITSDQLRDMWNKFFSTVLERITYEILETVCY